MVKKKKRKFVLPPGFGTNLKPRAIRGVSKKDKRIRLSLNPATVSATKKLLKQRRYYDVEISELLKALSSDPLAIELFGLKPVEKWSVFNIRHKMSPKPISKKYRAWKRFDPVTRRMLGNLIWSGKYTPKRIVEIMKELERPVSHISVYRLLKEKPAKPKYPLNKIREDVYRNPDALYSLLKRLGPPQRMKVLEKLALVRTELLSNLQSVRGEHARKIHAEILQDVNAVLKVLSSFISKEFFEENNIDVKSL